MLKYIMIPLQLFFYINSIHTKHYSFTTTKINHIQYTIFYNTKSYFLYLQQLAT